MSERQCSPSDVHFGKQNHQLRAMHIAVKAAALNRRLANRTPIRLGSGLLVFLDRLKKNSFLRKLDATLIQN